MKIESKEQALKFLRQRVRYFGGYNYLAVEKPEVEGLIAWLESTPTTTGWVESKDTGNPVPRVILWSDRITGFVDTDTSRSGGNIRETHHIPLPPLPEKPKPATIGERVVNRVFDVNMVMMTVNRATLAKLIDGAIAEDREGRQ